MKWNDFAQLLGGFILAGSYVPQIVQIYKTKCVDGISLAFWGWLTLAVMLIEANAIATGQMSFIIAQTLNLIGSITITLQVLKYRKKK